MSDITRENWHNVTRLPALSAKFERGSFMPLPLLDFAQLIKPDLETADFVEGLLIEGSMAVIYGESNSGKTFFASDLALHVALGWPWCGREVTQGAVIYCALEGAKGISNRVAAFAQTHNLAGQPVPFYVIPSTIDMRDPEADTERLILAILDVAARSGFPVLLVVIDTLARAMGGGNENAPDDMGAVVINTDRVRAATGACVAYIHHSGKDQAKGARGHSSLRAATDTEIEVTPAAEGGPAIAKTVKQRELETTGEFPFTLRVVELGLNKRGKPVTSCIVVPAAAPIPQFTVDRKLSADTQLALQILIDVIADRGATGQEGVPVGIYSVDKEAWRLRCYDRSEPGADPGAKRQAFHRASKKLIEMRRVGMDKGRVWLVRKGDEQASASTSNNEEA